MANLNAWKKIRTDCIQSGAQLIAVSKMRNRDEIMELYQAGQRHFGENRVDQLLEKKALLPTDIHWHMIGHLQRKKVKQLIPHVDMIHSVDTPELLEEINKRAILANKRQAVLLQLFIATESTKHGLSFEEAAELIASENFSNLEAIQVCGLMGMASFTDDQKQITAEFTSLQKSFQALKEKYFGRDENFRQLSMGMSSDYPLALAQGSTLVRVGSSLFN